MQRSVRDGTAHRPGAADPDRVRAAAGYRQRLWTVGRNDERAAAGTIDGDVLAVRHLDGLAAAAVGHQLRQSAARRPHVHPGTVGRADLLFYGPGIPKGGEA